MASVTEIPKFTKNVQVYVQIVHETEECWDDVKILDDKKTLYVRSIKDFYKKGNANNSSNYWTFMTDGILYGLDQTNIFHKLIKESLKDALMGIDFLIFAYGQTGTGKSTTINGIYDEFDERGFLPRILSELFEFKKSLAFHGNTTFSVSYVEIHSNYVVDLLQTKGSGILKNSHKGLQIIEIASQNDGIKLLFAGKIFVGESKKNMICTEYNSNIYTSVFTIYVQNDSTLNSVPVIYLSKIHIIDMAGSDTYGSPSCSWKRAKEVGIGNLNKTQLEICLLSIQKDLIVSTNSIKDGGILVDYLGESLKAQSKIKFFAHIRSDRKSLALTISTLRFLNTARKIKPAKLKPLYKESSLVQIKHLNDEIKELEHKIYLNSMLMDVDLSHNLTLSTIEQMQNAIENFTRDKINSVELLNVTNVNIAMNLFKQMCRKLQNQIDEIKKSNTLDAISEDTTIKTPLRQQSFESESRMSAKSTKSKEARVSKKRVSSLKIFRHSKTTPIPPSFMYSSGTLAQTGISFGELRSYNYEGDLAKSLKLRTKLLSKTMIVPTATENMCLGIDKTVSVVNLPNLGGDYDIIWNEYIEDKNYSYKSLTEDLKNAEQNTKTSLIEFNDKAKLLHELVQDIKLKKKELSQLQMYETHNIYCTPEDEAKLNKVKEQFSLQLIELINNTGVIKEELLFLQSNINMKITEYKRIKNFIIKDFKLFCHITYNTKLPMTENILEGLACKFCGTIKPVDALSFEKINAIDMFYKCQKEMKNKINCTRK